MPGSAPAEEGIVDVEKRFHHHHYEDTNPGESLNVPVLEGLGHSIRSYWPCLQVHGPLEPLQQVVALETTSPDPTFVM